MNTDRPYAAEPRISAARRWPAILLTKSRLAETIIIGMFVLLLTLGWLRLIQETSAHLEDVRKDYENRIFNVTQISAEALRATLSLADETLLNLRESWHRDPDQFSQTVLRRKNVTRLKVAFDIAVIDAKGRVVFSSMHTPGAGMDVSDSAHFLAHATTTHDLQELSPPTLARMADRWVLPISRPLLRDPDGQFKGVMVMFVDPQFLAYIFESSRLADDSSFTLFNVNDGRILLRSLADEGDLDSEKRSTLDRTQLPPTFTHLPPNALINARQLTPTGVGVWSSALDDTERTYSWHRYGAWPLMLMVGEPTRYRSIHEDDERNRLLMTGAFFTAILAIVAALVIALLRSRQRLLETSEAKLNAEKTHRQALEESHAQLRRLAQYLDEARERERKQLALDVHDELGQRLTALRLRTIDIANRLNALAQEPTPAQCQLIGRDVQVIRSQLEDCLATVREMAESMRPASLQLGLVPALHALCDEFQLGLQRQCLVEVDDQRHTPLPDDLIEPCYRIAQEALTNAIRHAHAQTIRLRLTLTPKELRLTVSDDGQGMSPGAVERHGGLGLLGMRERTRHLGGILEISSQPVTGTIVTLILPTDVERSLPETTTPGTESR